MHLTFIKLNLPGSKVEKVIFERNSKRTKRYECQLELHLETSSSGNS